MQHIKSGYINKLLVLIYGSYLKKVTKKIKKNELFLMTYTQREIRADF